MTFVKLLRGIESKAEIEKAAFAYPPFFSGGLTWLNMEKAL